MLIRRLGKGKDTGNEIKRICEEENIRTGWFNVIGALSGVKYGFYEQDQKEYREHIFNSACEIVSCTGNISLLDGEVFVHAHIVFAGNKGTALGGHLLKSTVFAAEAVIFPSAEPPLERKMDEETGLKLWK